MEQLELFAVGSTGNPAPVDAPRSKDVFYLALSQLQKCVRLGLTEMALKSARVVWEDNQWKAFTRLVTIIGEDVGRDHDLVDFILDFQSLGHSFKRWESIAELTIRMSESQRKTHEVHDSLFARDAMGKDPLGYYGLESPLKLISEASFAKLIPSLDMERGEYVEVMTKAISPYVEFGADKLERLYNMMEKVDREHQLICYPLWRAADAIKEASGFQFEAVDETVRIPALKRTCDSVLLNAVDCHTVPGKYAFAVYKKKVPFEATDAELRELEWVALAGKLNCVLTDRPFHDKWRGDWLEKVEWMEANADNVMDVRDWVIRKKFPHLMESLR